MLVTMDIILSLSVIVPSFYIIYKLMDSLEEVQKEYYEQREKLMEDYHKKAIALIKKENKVVEEVFKNDIEDKQVDEIPIDETTKIPIMDGMKVKYDDSEDIFPVSIQ